MSKTINMNDGNPFIKKLNLKIIINISRNFTIDRCPYKILRLMYVYIDNIMNDILKGLKG